MKRILVIDDDSQIRDMLRRMLEYAGYDVVEAEDGDDGLRQLAAEGADLVITDILMPNKEGLETIIALRRTQPNLPVIAISGGGWSGSLGYLNTADKLGAAATLPKPFSRVQMLDAVGKVLGTPRAA
ncbi:MAG: response regulator [Fimbriimonadaceae bacterium]|nr:response regulator [Fimbriimonadaceae bacterium]